MTAFQTKPETLKFESEGILAGLYLQEIILLGLMV